MLIVKLHQRMRMERTIGGPRGALGGTEDVSSDDVTNEIQRLKDVYARRTVDPTVAKRNSLLNVGTRFNLEERDRCMQELIARHFPEGLAKTAILDVGCGTGELLTRLKLCGAQPELFWGVDLMADRIERAQKHHPEAQFVACSAHSLPFADGAFDLVSQFTLLSSIVRSEVKRSVAGEM